MRKLKFPQRIQTSIGISPTGILSSGELKRSFPRFYAAWQASMIFTRMPCVAAHKYFQGVHSNEKV
jgi:hypothetical protein